MGFLTLESVCSHSSFRWGTHQPHKNTQNELSIAAKLRTLWMQDGLVEGRTCLLSVPPHWRFVEASGLFTAGTTLEFCICFITFHQLLSVFHVTYNALPGKDMT